MVIKAGKHYIIFGNMTMLTSKDTVKHILNGKLWLGVSIHRGGRYFEIPPTYTCDTDESAYINGKPYIGVKGVRWFTDIDHPQRHVPLKTNAVYNMFYPRYDAYPAIDVSSYKEIPMDYNGVMGVPITIMDFWCPEQFEILGTTRYHDGNDKADDVNYINGRLLYQRMLIRRIQ